jgi:hypothetical protein
LTASPHPTEPEPSAARGYLGEFPPRCRHVLAGAACVAVVYFAGVTNQWWPTPDSAMYQGLGRSLLRGEGYRFNGQFDNVVTPGTPALLGAIWWAFGEGFWAKNLFMSLCGLASLWMAYRTVSLLTDRRMAFAATLAAGASYAYFHYAHLILTDAPFALLFWCLAYCCVRYLRAGTWRPALGWLALAVPISAAAVTVRAPGLLVIGAFAAGMVLDRLSRRTAVRNLVGAAGVLGAGVATAAAFYAIGKRLGGTTPRYVAHYLTNPKMDLGFRLTQMAGGLAKLPNALAETVLGQGGLGFAIAGGLLLALAIVSMVRLWRRGERLVPVALVLVCAGLGFASLARAVRPRYLMPVHVLFVYTILDGLCTVAGWIARRCGRQMKPFAFLLTVSIAVGVLIAANVPRLMRGSLVYGLAGHFGRYHEVIEDAKYVDLHPGADVLRRSFGPDVPVATRTDRMSMFHYLSERRIARLLKTERETAAEAEAVHRDFLARPEIRGVVLDLYDGAEPFRLRLGALFAATAKLGQLDLLYDGRFFKVYRRVEPAAPPTAPATRPVP